LWTSGAAKASLRTVPIAHCCSIGARRAAQGGKFGMVENVERFNPRPQHAA
jgi:hypothetical protein